MGTQMHPGDVSDAGTSPFACTAPPNDVVPAGKAHATAVKAHASAVQTKPLHDETAAAANDDNMAEFSSLSDKGGHTGQGNMGGPKSRGAVSSDVVKHSSKSSSYNSGGGGSSSRKARSKKLIPLKQVIRCSYEYHGLNDLFFFCITALAVTMVLYWHWGETTATFKATVQRSFQQYGNPDWQTHSLDNVDTMHDAVEYSIGWLEFWLRRANSIGWSNNTVRVGEFGDIKYVRLLVNIDRNCDKTMSPAMECYIDSKLTQDIRSGQHGGRSYNNLLDWAGWQSVGALQGRESANAGSYEANRWWAYAIIAPRFHGNSSSRDDYIGRMYNVTRDTNLNYHDCDWAAHSCADLGPYTKDGPSGPACSRGGTHVPFKDWWSSPVMCSNGSTKDIMSPGSTGIQRGQRHFVRHPLALDPQKTSGTPNVMDLKPFLSKYSYSIALDVLASNAVHNEARGVKPNGSDMALFTMTLQRSAQAKEEPDRILWQITSTIPVRTSFYNQATDIVRIGFEVLMYICLVAVLSLQARQIYVCYEQHSSFKPWLGHFWNCFEAVSNVTLLAWVIYYWVLFVRLQHQSWSFGEWDVQGMLAHDQLNSITLWATSYSAWLYMGIIVDVLFCLRLARYMRIHVGLKAFYQVFLIAAREFLDFAVFLFYILVLLGSAVFAFFQLTGGNYQFLRFPDGLSLMSRLTFGFLSYDEFQSQALGVGAAVSAVTFLFWVAVILLVVYTQNIILAIVAEAYEEAKAKLGTAETSFVMLVLMRLLFLFLFVIYRIRMLIRDVCRACTGRQPSMHSPSFVASRSLHGFPRFFKSTPGQGTTGNTRPPSQHAAQGPPAPANDSSDKPLPQHSMADLWSVDELDEDSQLPLAATLSQAVLPADVEVGLAGGSGTFARHSSSLLGSLESGRHNSGQLADSRRASIKVAGAASNKDLGASTSAAAAAAACDIYQEGGAGCAEGSALQKIASKAGRETPPSFWQSLSGLWHDIILGERHMLRMYRDIVLAPGQKEDSWSRGWKERYWRPWCVARTAPLRCLTNLYLDFASYKLKAACTWTANAAAKDVISSTWDAPQRYDCRADVAGYTGSKDAAADCNIQDGIGLLAALPVLLDEVYVDEDTLARLFLVCSNMSPVLRIWQPPFHRLSNTEVRYLVKGISEVHGVEAETVTSLGDGHALQLSSMQGAVDDSGCDEGGHRPPVIPTRLQGANHTASSELQDAQLGEQVTRRGTGGFVSSLNSKRRGTGAEQSRQISLLLHTHRRLEEATSKSTSQLYNVDMRLSQQMALQDDFQRKQQRTNNQLLSTMQELSTLFQAQQAALQLHPSEGRPTSPAAGGTEYARRTSFSSGGGGGGGAAAAPVRVSTIRRLESVAVSATSRVFSPFSGASSLGPRPSHSTVLAGPSEQHVPSAEGPSGEGRSDGGPTSGEALAQIARQSDEDQVLRGNMTSPSPQQAASGCNADVHAGSTIAHLQQQLQQQQKTLERQEKLLQLVLSRLPSP